LKFCFVDEIRKFSTPKTFPNHTSYLSISVEHIADLSRISGVSKQDIEISALENGIVPERYARNMNFFSMADQATLLKSCVSVVGLGGLGGAVTEILTRLGIGRLNLIDGDHFEANNLNRQLFSTEKLLGRSKTEAALKRVKAVNSSIVVNTHSEFLNGDNAPRLLDSSDVVVDCLDNIPTRFVLENAAKQKGCPFVSAAIAGVSGQVTTIFPEDQGLKLIYGHKDDTAKRAEDSLGTLPLCVMLMASIECSEVVKILLGRGSLLRNKLLIIDLMSNHHELMQLI